MYIPGTISAGGDVGGGPARIGRSVVFIPGNGVIVMGGRDNIQVAIAIHISNVHVIGTISARGDISGTPAWIGCAVIFVPGDGVVVYGGRNNVEVAIAVHVGDVDILSTVGIGCDISGTPAGIGCPIILVPGNGVIVMGGRDNIQVAITIHISNVHVIGTISARRDISSGPARIGRTVVLVPGNGVI